jgi:hypothetical protein
MEQMKTVLSILLIVLVGTIGMASVAAAAAAQAETPDASVQIVKIHSYDNGVKHRVNLADPHVDIASGPHIISFEVTALYAGPAGTFGQVYLRPVIPIEPSTLYIFEPDFMLLPANVKTNMSGRSAYFISGTDTEFTVKATGRFYAMMDEITVTFDFP